MNKVSSDHVKILFDIESDGTTDVESMWAVPVAGGYGGYQIDNIPFYVRGVACGDIVAANRESDGILRYEKLASPSGHSTIRLWFQDVQNVQKIRDQLSSMGCQSELDLERLVAVDIPPSVPYGKVLHLLKKGEQENIFEYEEGCLGQRAPEGAERDG